MTGVGTKVNWNVVLSAEVPPGLVTVTSSVPGGDNGVTSVIDVSLATVMAVSATPAKLTAVAPVNPVPVIVRLVPPLAGPSVTESHVTRGTGTKPNART